MRIRSFLALCAGLGCAFACSDAPSEPLTRDVFVDVVVELRQASEGVRDSAVFAARKDEILRAHGVTDSMLVEYVRRHAGDIQSMSEIWDTIDARLAVPADTSESDETGETGGTSSGETDDPG